MGLLDSLASFLGISGSVDPQRQQYGSPIGPGLLGSPGADDPSPGLLSFGTQRPVMLTPEQYNANKQTLGGILGAFANGTIPGLSNLAGGDANANAAGYNAQLGQGQSIERARLDLAPWERLQQQQPGAAAGPAQARLPSMPLQGPGAGGVPLPDGSGMAPASAGLWQGQQQPQQPAQAPAGGGGLLDPSSIGQRINFLSSFPGGIDAATKLYGVLDNMNKLGTGFDASGNQIRLGGANSADYQKSLYDAMGKNLQSMSPDGTVTSLPGVIADAGNKAQATAYGTASGTGAGQLPTAFSLAQQKAAGEGQGQLPTAQPLAAAKAAGEFPYKITSLRPDATAGTPAQLGISPNPGIGNLGTIGPAMGKSSEEVKRGQTLGEQSDTIDKAATASEGLQGRMQFIQRELPKATVGSFADRKAEIGRMLIGLGISPKTVESQLGNIASADVLQKEFYRLSTDQVKGLGREPGYILDKITSANPNLETQPEAMLLMTNAINQGAQRDLDKRDARDAWLTDPKHMKSLAGFEATFNRTNPQDDYVNRAYQATDGVPPNSQLIGTKNGNRVWQLQNGSKVMARH